MAAVSSDLLARLATTELDAARGRLGEALRDNPEGEALLGDAIERAAQIGFDAWCDVAGAPPEAPEDDLWDRWWAQRQLAPEAASWPVRLAYEGEIGAEAIAAAEQELFDAGIELGLTGRGRGRYVRRLQELGTQAAEAGAALRCALDQEPEPEPLPVATPAEPIVVERHDGLVRVATTANLPECEMLQGLLETEGIRSSWLRSGGDAPDYMAAGWRDIYVMPADAERARAVLAIVEDDGVSAGDRPTSVKVGLERAPLRRVGKVGVVLYVIGVVGFALLTAALAASGASLSADGTLAVLVGYVVLALAVVVWSERR